MRNGIYRVVFQTPLGTGAGVAILSSGEIRGGDSAMYYSGRYELAEGSFTADVHAAKHTDFPGMNSVFGIDEVNIKLNGSFNGDAATLNGFAQEVPTVRFVATLNRLGD